MWKKYLSPIIFTVQIISTTAFAKVTAEQFIHEVEEHRARLQHSAQIVKRDFPLLFGKFSEEQLTEYLFLHDLPKVLTLEELKSYGYKAQISLAERLALFHGANFKDLSDADALELKSTINDLNETEVVMKMALFKKNKWPMKLISSLRLLENIVDLTDVGIFRVKEMGISGERYDGARFLLKRGEVLASHLSRHLEDQLRGETHLDKRVSCKKALNP